MVSMDRSRCCSRDREAKDTKEQSSQTHASLEQNQPLPAVEVCDTLSDTSVSDSSVCIHTHSEDGADATTPKVVSSVDCGLDTDGESPEVTPEQGLLGAEGHGGLADDQCAQQDGVIEVTLQHPIPKGGGKRTPLQSSDSVEAEYLQSASELCTSERPRSYSSSFSHLSLSSSLPRSCDLCRAADRLLLCSHSKDFWYSIRSDTCCERVWSDFHDKLKATFPQDPAFKGGKARIMPLLKSLLGVNESLEKVHIKSFLRVIKFIGPFRAEQDRCVVLKQLEDLLEHSFIKDPKNRKQKISWFAGPLSRKDADAKLKERPTGTFLIRLSETQSEEGSFSLALVMADESLSLHHRGTPVRSHSFQPLQLNADFPGKEVF
ncbi:uncharacterized protein LOC124263253 [Haliotis rubra]|uniref:uncharacterized protein LOC124263253 n=1 Tax=Haliotis rubra TaxID=36100 RepID=UPI001EE53474|nr:uncharacterized protein LOC124263253 [Haliotis rubra]